MHEMNRTLVAAAVLAALIPATAAFAQAPAKKDAPAKAPAATSTPAAPSGKTLYPQGQYDLLLKERLAQGAQDTPELRNAVKEELNTRELLAREARKQGLDKTTDMKTQMDLAGQTVLVRAYVADWIAKNPIPESELKAEYDKIKAQIGDKEYKVKHVLLEKEDEAKEVIAELQKGAKFDDLAKGRSKDPGSKDKGGDLDWNAPGSFVKPFGDAMAKTPKGKFSPQPVQTQFGWHVILVEDVRQAKFPGYDEIKPQLTERMQEQAFSRSVADLRAKAKVE
jgi:peptidyl-prolyl cis-trans isomerase C